MSQQIVQYVNPVPTAIKKLGGSTRPAEVCAAVIKDMGLENSPLLEQSLKSGVGIILTMGSFSADAVREAVRDGVPPI